MSDPDGAFPFSGITWDAYGNLYGTTYGGGSGTGMVYELSPNGSGGWNEEVIYDRGGYAGLTIDGSGNLYGADDAKNGHIFELSPNGSGGGMRPSFTPSRAERMTAAILKALLSSIAPETCMAPPLAAAPNCRRNGLEADSRGRGSLYRGDSLCFHLE